MLLCLGLHLYSLVVRLFVTALMAVLVVVVVVGSGVGVVVRLAVLAVLLIDAPLGIAAVAVVVAGIDVPLVAFVALVVAFVVASVAFAGLMPVPLGRCPRLMLVVHLPLLLPDRLSSRCR